MTFRSAVLVFAAVLLSGLLSGCEGNRIAPLYRDHELVNRIWVPGQNRFATAGEVYFMVESADFVLLGEKHDNPDHHRLQGQLIAKSGGKKNRPVAVVMEMLRESQQVYLDYHVATKPGDIDGIGPAVYWERSGWPEWRIYKHIAEAAHNRNAPLYYGSLERDAIKAIAREGLTALGEERVQSLKLMERPGEALEADMRTVIGESHCGQLPEPMLAPMVNVTLAKDAVMAERLIAARGGDAKTGAILIAGNGHARADWGVPFHLRRLAPDSSIAAIGLVEVQGEETDPAAYAEPYGGEFPFDYVWFTARMDDDDPCAVFAEQLKQMREKGKQQKAPESN